MSYGGQSNTPWQRGNINMPQQSNMGSFNQQNVGNFGNTGNVAFPQQNNSSFGNNMYPSNLIAYPQQRNNMNSTAFQQGSIGNIPQPRYNVMGTITKINNDCGLINDEVFFYRNICKGANPKLGDRTVFDATFSTTGQFKWNANRVQVMPQPPSLMGPGYNPVPPVKELSRGQQAQRRNSAVRDRSRRSRERDDGEHDRKKRREDNARSNDRSSARQSVNNSISSRGRQREDVRRSDVSLERKEREKAREREKEIERERPDRNIIKGRRNRPIRRYAVKIPNSLLSFKNVDIQELRESYTTLYIPSDFFYANIKWPKLFKPENPFPLNRLSQFTMKHKSVEPLEEPDPEMLEPKDANFLYSAKVMLLACPSISDIYQKCFEDKDNDRQPVHPLRLISFLVGTCGRNEPMAIGGAWSPSLDGENPDKDPSVLIRTAIRTCKALTGIDLSKCTQWYRFMELHYHRADYKNREADGPPRVETVVFYLPDVHSCMPNQLEWEKLTLAYKAALDDVIQRKTAIAKSSGAETSVEAGGEQMEVETIDISETESNAGDETAGSIDADADESTQNEEEQAGTHFSKLEVKSMKLQEIKDELAARDLPNKGTRNILMTRLTKALNTEKEEEENAKKIDDAAKTAAKTPAKQVAAKEATKTPAKQVAAKEEGKTPSTKQVAAKTPAKQVGAKTPGKPVAVKEAVKTPGKAVVAKKNEAKEKTPNKKAKAEEKQATDNENVEDQEDIDMSDIVILDEYDSLNPEKELNEKEKKNLIRRYNLPSTPHIIVHPNKLAKGGKFHCTVMPLTMLLDYRLGDAKERFFEVSLFAELFKEMLTRDFGFNIYKELYFYKANKESESTESNEVEENKEKKEESAKEDTDNDEKTKSESKVVNGETPSTKSSSDRKQAASASNSKDKDKDKNKDNDKNKEKENDKSSNKKMVVVKPHLLLSFLFFDTTHCGYIFENDLEKLFLIIGLNLSRGQIRSLLSKLTTRLAFYYRELTDKEESPEALPVIENISNDLPEEQLRKIALGNRQYTFVFDPDSDGTQESLPAVASTNEGSDLVNYNGAVVHVGRLMDQIKRTENSYADLETLYNDLRKQHTDLQKDTAKSTNKVKDLQSEVKSLSRKLSDADQKAVTLNRKYRNQHTTLSFIHNRVSVYFSRDKEKDKLESSRDKNSAKNKDEKEKEKEKDNQEKEKNKNQEKEKVTQEKETETSVEKQEDKASTEKDDKENKDKANKEKETKTDAVEKKEKKESAKPATNKKIPDKKKSAENKVISVNEDNKE